MQVSKTFPGWDSARWSRPWFAKVGTWPDSGPAVMTFGKTTKGAIPPACTIEADAGDVVRWGMKDLATGQADPAQSGWGVVRPGGGIIECSQLEARETRRGAHPEDANAAVIRPAGFAKGRGNGRPRAAAAPAPGPAPAAAAEPDYLTRLHQAVRDVLDSWNNSTDRPFPLQAPMQALALLVPDTVMALIDKPGPVAPVEAEEPEEEESVAAPAPRAVDVDENGIPLF